MRLDPGLLSDGHALTVWTHGYGASRILFPTTLSTTQMNFVHGASSADAHRLPRHVLYSRMAVVHDRSYDRTASEMQISPDHT